MLALRLPEALEKRLDALAKRTGRRRAYVREAILRHLYDLEDAYLARKRLERVGEHVSLERP